MNTKLEKGAKVTATRNGWILDAGSTYTVVGLRLCYGGVPAVKLSDKRGGTFELIGYDIAEYFAETVAP